MLLYFRLYHHSKRSESEVNVDEKCLEIEEAANLLHSECVWRANADNSLVNLDQPLWISVKLHTQTEYAWNGRSLFKRMFPWRIEIASMFRGFSPARRETYQRDRCKEIFSILKENINFEGFKANKNFGQMECGTLLLADTQCQKTDHH